MASSALKISSAIIGVGGVAGGAGTGIYYAFRKEPEAKDVKVTLTGIKELLKTDNKELITETGDAAWPKAWEAFVDAHNDKDPSTLWSVNDWTNKKRNKQDVPEDFKGKCATHGNKAIQDKRNAIYEEVKKYCTKDLTVQQPS